VIAEACGVGDDPVGFQAGAVENRLLPVPGMSEVPHLVAADDDVSKPSTRSGAWSEKGSDSASGEGFQKARTFFE
jgi:hypothetical protein